ncbi:MAG TPA: HIT family hydrolase [Lentisphaeria bacterium]|nr:MAG: HIT family hydrolase [Lentisphaerae bacterium GWF2_38_69]HBM15475.1 HIT family hydrolase [Lentisphaeria bacterium]
MKKLKNLWAPWRIEYILSAKDQGCFLCDRKQYNSTKPDEEYIIYRGKNSFVMINAYPYNSGHLLIAPYLHTGDIETLNKEILYEISDLMVLSKQVLAKVMKPAGYNVGYNFGSAAGAGCEEHLHLHIVPRWIGDVNFMPVIGDIKVMPQSLRDTAKILRSEFPA